MKKETTKAGQTTIDFLLQAPGNGVSAAAFEFTVPAGAKVPVTYYHEHFNETIYGMERIITFTVEARAVDITPGETCFIPCAAVHGLESELPVHHFLSQIKDFAA
jgi:quercetin dioxygenase-like cupin family protein